LRILWQSVVRNRSLGYRRTAAVLPSFPDGTADIPALLRIFQKSPPGSVVLAPCSIQSAPNAPLVPIPLRMQASTHSVLEPNLEMSSPCPHSIPVHSQIWSPLLGQAPRRGRIKY